MNATKTTKTEAELADTFFARDICRNRPAAESCAKAMYPIQHDRAAVEQQARRWDCRYQEVLAFVAAVCD